MGDYSSALTVDGSGNYTLNTGAVVSTASNDALNALGNLPSNASDAQVNEILGSIVGAMAAGITFITGSAAATGPFFPIAAGVFALAEWLTTTSVGAHGVSDFYCYDCEGNYHDSPGTLNPSDYVSFAEKNCCPACMQYNPGWYEIPGSAATCHITENVGSGIKNPNWPAGSFEAFAEKLLLTDYQKNFTYQDSLEGKVYNFARWPALLSLAVESWNKTHSAPPDTTVFGITTSKGTRRVSTAAKSVDAWGTTYVEPLNGDPLQIALWLSQYSQADWKDGTALSGKTNLSPGESIGVTIHNGPKIQPKIVLKAAAPLPKAKGNPVQIVLKASPGFVPFDAQPTKTGTPPVAPANPTKTILGMSYPEAGMLAAGLGALGYLARKAL